MEQFNFEQYVVKQLEKLDELPRLSEKISQLETRLSKIEGKVETLDEFRSGTKAMAALVAAAVSGIMSLVVAAFSVFLAKKWG